MTELKIKFTTKVYDEESPIELSIEEARELYEELGKVFGMRCNANRLNNNYSIKIDPENMISTDELNKNNDEMFL